MGTPVRASSTTPEAPGRVVKWYGIQPLHRSIIEIIAKKIEDWIFTVRAMQANDQLIDRRRGRTPAATVALKVS